MNTIKTFFKNMSKGPAVLIGILAGLSLGIIIGTCMTHGGHRSHRGYGEMKFHNNQGYGYQNQREMDNGMMNNMWGMRGMKNGQNQEPSQNTPTQPQQAPLGAPATTTVGQ